MEKKTDYFSGEFESMNRKQMDILEIYVEISEISELFEWLQHQSILKVNQRKF